MNSETEEPPATSACSECRENLRAGARVCPHCQNSQTSWRRHSLFAAQIVGVVTVMASLITYLVTAVPNAWDSLFGSEAISVLAFKSNESLVIFNNGSRAICLTAMDLKLDLGVAGVRDIRLTLNTVVRPHEVHAQDLRAAGEGPRTVVSGTPDRVWAAFLWRLSNAGDICVLPVVSQKSDPHVSQVIYAPVDPGDAVRIFPVEARLDYYSLRDLVARSVTVHAVGWAEISHSEACKDLP